MRLGSFRAIVKVDDPETESVREVRIKVKRMTVAEGTKFASDYHKSANPPSNVMIARKGEGDEQEKRLLDVGTEKEREEFVISDSEVMQRRKIEMTDEQREIYARLDAAEEAFSNGFIMDTLKRYVRVLPGQDLESVDDFDDENAKPKTIETGADLAHSFGAHPTVIRDLLRIVHLENAQNVLAKKVLKPVFGFVRSSVEHETVADGQKPDQTADVASKPDSVAIEDAGRNTMAPSSGETATA